MAKGCRTVESLPAVDGGDSFSAGGSDLPSPRFRVSSGDTSVLIVEQIRPLITVLPASRDPGRLGPGALVAGAVGDMGLLIHSFFIDPGAATSTTGQALSPKAAPWEQSPKPVAWRTEGTKPSCRSSQGALPTGWPWALQAISPCACLCPMQSCSACVLWRSRSKQEPALRWGAEIMGKASKAKGAAAASGGRGLKRGVAFRVDPAQ